MKVKNIKLKYFNPFYWINRRKNRELYAIILASKYHYISKYKDGYKHGLCLSFICVFTEFYGSISMCEIKKLIPELNRKFFNISHTCSFWWDLDDYSSRINAFNKLLECYKNKI